MAQHALNLAFVRAVTPGDRPRRYRDGNGLYLLVKPGTRGGGKPWVQRLTFHGREHEFGLGSFKDVSLKEAREIALENRRTARRGGDAHAAGRRTGRAPVFVDALETVIAIRQPGRKGGPQRAGLWRASFRRVAFPRIGRTLADGITTADVRAVLAPTWTTTPHMARQIRQRIGAAGGARFWFHALRNCFISVADRDLIRPANLTKRLVNHSRPQDVTEGYAADWTMQQLRYAVPHTADKIDEFIRLRPLATTLISAVLRPLTNFTKWPTRASSLRRSRCIPRLRGRGPGRSEPGLG